MKRRMLTADETGASQTPPMAGSQIRKKRKLIPGAKLAVKDGRIVWLFPEGFKIPADWRKRGRPVREK